MNQIIETLLVFVSTGCLGSINYFVAKSVSAIDTDTSNANSAKGIALIFTTLDLLIYSFIKLLLGLAPLSFDWKILISLTLTIIISISVSLCFSRKLNGFFYSAVNSQRNKDGLVSISSSTPWKAITLSGNEPQRAFLYSFDHQPLGFGYVQYTSNSVDDNYSVSIVPFTDDEKEQQPPYEDLIANIQTTEYKKENDVQQYVNFKQKFIMITAISKKQD